MDSSANMSVKSKKVTYKDPNEENGGYLNPCSYETNSEVPSRHIASSVKRQYGVYGSIHFLIMVLLHAGVPISQFVIGFIFIGQCTIRPFIFVYMILSGAFGIALTIVGLVIFFKISRLSLTTYDEFEERPMALRILIPVFTILLLSVIGWWIAGQVIIFQVKTTVEYFDPVLPEYCHGHLYKAAYVLIFVDYLLAVIDIILYKIARLPPADNTVKKRVKRPVPIRKK